MKIKPHSRKQQRHLVEHLVNSFGHRQHKQAYASIVNNIIGLTRKVQSLNKRLRNNATFTDGLNAQLAEEQKQRLYCGSTQLGVGDGTGNLFVYGDYDSIKAAQRIVLRDSDNRIEAYKLANHMRGSMGSLPEEWEEWAAEIEQAIRSLAGMGE